jgi:hypothetical protein
MKKDIIIFVTSIIITAVIVGAVIGCIIVAFNKLAC